MASKSRQSTNENNEQFANNNVGVQILLVVGETLFLFLKIFYYICESVVKLFYPSPLKDVKGKIVLITGTGHGIGRELAYVYASEGSTVVGWDLNEKGNRETFENISKKKYTKGYHYKCDVSNREEVLQTAKKVQEEVGHVDILINNAGIMPCHPLENHTPEEIEKIFKVNVYAHFWTIEAFLPNMKKNNDGHIVALSSCAGLFGLKYLVPYCASKYGVRGLMEGLYNELRFNPNNRIKISTVFPYITNTGLCKNPKIKFQNAMAMLEPEEVARTIIRGQRKELYDIGVPSYFVGLNNSTRILPFKAQMAVQDFLDAYIDSDLY